MKAKLGFLMAMFLPLALFAQVVPAAPQSVDQAIGLLPVLVSFFKNGQYLLAGAVVTLIVCFVCNQYIFPKLNLGPALIPILSGIVGILSGVGLAVANGASPMQAALAVLSGSVATHLWESLLKYFISKAQPIPPAA